jgi:hypothetical protein
MQARVFYSLEQERLLGLWCSMSQYYKYGNFSRITVGIVGAEPNRPLPENIPACIAANYIKCL